MFEYSVDRFMFHVIVDSDKELFLTQSCFSQQVVEPNFSMVCIMGKKKNYLECDPLTLSTNI